MFRFNVFHLHTFVSEDMSLTHTSDKKNICAMELGSTFTNPAWQ